MLFPYSGNENMIEILIKSDADVNIADKLLKETPLHLAARNGNL